MTQFHEPRVTAVLGPTNTGKTHLAIERMLGHSSGMIGFPLRLLARENYDRVVKLKGAGQVALITGEEKIAPPNARYFCCTVESMPVDRVCAFLAVDEIQLCADPERGHIFTDRLLHARGSEETMFLGADTLRPVLRSLVPEAEIVSRPRFSTLSYAGPQKITRLPPRSAVVAFSAAEVYAAAELMRRRRGGTAVVLGALSPRTRNAQVGMFEAGEVDHRVATDAIGMGLNLSLDHVAFARLSKFDGRGPRRLTPAEIGQIAGRAGRHMSDGTFGTTAEAGTLEAEMVEAVENHRFDPLRHVFWRNRNLDFSAPRALLRSLERAPPTPQLLRARDADDFLALQTLSGDEKVARLARAPAAVRLLWEVCQIPDFRKTLTDHHTAMLRRIYGFLMENDGRVGADWVSGHIGRLDRSDGDIDQLIARIAHVRTWTYITHRGDWFDDAAHWQERTRAIEDKLSDALHERLTQRFVDRRAAILVRRLRAGAELIGAIRNNGEVLVEGEFVGRLEGFRFLLDSSIDPDAAKPVFTAARRALGREIPLRLKALEDDNDGSFALVEDRITWRGAALGHLTPGETALGPRVTPLASEFLDGRARERVRLRLARWLERHVKAQLRPLFKLQAAALDGAARGLLFQLVEALGTLPRQRVAEQVGGLGKADRKALAELGVRLGAASVFVPSLLKPKPMQLRARLWCLKARKEMPQLPPLDSPSFRPGRGCGEALCLALGYRRLLRQGAPPLAVRADVLERAAQAAHKASSKGSLGPGSGLAKLADLAGCTAEDLETLLSGLRFRRLTGGAGASYAPRKAAPDAKRPRRQKTESDSPFAVLRDLVADDAVANRPTGDRRAGARPNGASTAGDKTTADKRRRRKARSKTANETRNESKL